MTTSIFNHTVKKRLTNKPLFSLAFVVLLTCFVGNAIAKTTRLYPKIELKKGMSYVETRMSLLKSGWLTPDLPKGGYHPSDEQVASKCYGNTGLCNALPEIEACSGTGLGECRLVFHYRHRYQLSIFTTGDIDLWRNTRRSKAGYPSVSGWTVKRITSKNKF